MAIQLSEITAFLDALLEIPDAPDYPGSYNGLQFDAASGKIHGIAAAVDASLRTIEQAAQNDGSLLIVHHGLYWKDLRPVIGATSKKLARMFESRMAVYSAHLPLDWHPTLGNNSLLLGALGLKASGTFFSEFDRDIGLTAHITLHRSEIVSRLEQAVGGPVRTLSFGPETTSKIGVVTGGAGSGLAKAAEAGVDTFITGEGPHHTHALAQDFGINVLYAGHYATEIFGVKALGEFTARHFGLPWHFIDDPSGL